MSFSFNGLLFESQNTSLEKKKNKNETILAYKRLKLLGTHQKCVGSQHFTCYKLAVFIRHISYGILYVKV